MTFWLFYASLFVILALRYLYGPRKDGTYTKYDV